MINYRNTGNDDLKLDELVWSMERLEHLQWTEQEYHRSPYF